MAPFTGSSAFELPSPGAPTLPRSYSCHLKMSHSDLPAGTLIKGLNCINSHALVLFVQREKNEKKLTFQSKSTTRHGVQKPLAHSKLSISV